MFHAPYGYIRNKETGHLEIEPIEAQVVKEIFDLYSKGHSMRNIANTMKDNNAYLKMHSDVAAAGICFPHGIRLLADLGKGIRIPSILAGPHVG